MPQVGIEATIPVFERAKTVHALDRAAKVIDTDSTTLKKYLCCGAYAHGKQVIISFKE
jgi:hypothetical protein